MGIEFRIKDRFECGHHQREVFRLASSHHTVDCCFLGGEMAVPFGDRAEYGVGCNVDDAKKLLNQIWRWWDYGKTICPTALKEIFNSFGAGNVELLGHGPGSSG